MITVPETKYAKSGDFHIAYQAIGAGPPDLVFMHGWISHIEHMWEEPRMARFLDRLASFARLIVLDKRGTGLSDPVPLDRLPTLEERMDDVRAVLDAVGSQRAAFLGFGRRALAGCEGSPSPRNLSARSFRGWRRPGRQYQTGRLRSG